MSAFANSTDLPEEEADSLADLSRQRKIVFIRGDAVGAVAKLKWAAPT